MTTLSIFSKSEKMGSRPIQGASEPPVTPTTIAMSMLQRELAMVDRPIKAPKANLRFLIPAALMVFADMVGLTVISIVAALLLPGASALEPNWFSTAIFFSCYSMAGLYPGIAAHPVDELRRLTLASTLALGLSLMMGATRTAVSLLLPKSIATWLLVLAAVPLMRALVRAMTRRCPWAGVPTLVVGAGRAGQRVVRALERNPQFGLRPVGVLDDDPELYRRAPMLHQIPYLGGISNVAHAAAKHGVEHAVIAIEGRHSRAWARLVSESTVSLPRVVVVPEMLGAAGLWVRPCNVGGIFGIEINQLLAQRWPQRMKRASDFALAGAGLLGLSPLFLLLYILIRLESRGPGLYFQNRVGLEGVPFRLWKFRSMYSDSDRILERALRDPELAAEWTRSRKLRNDPRATVIGRLLRKLSLDELPQLWNVLRGDMSLVGPRPIVHSEIARYRDKFASYALVRPGITGLWQVSGRNHTTYSRRINLDEYYVRNWSIWLDAYVLARTVKTVVTGEGAY